MRVDERRQRMIMSYGGLLAEPFDTCIALGHYLQNRNLGSKVLHVDLSRDVALRFADECGAIQVGQSDVVEVLLRAWLTERGRTDFE